MLILGATVLVSWLDPLKVLVRLPIDSGKLVISGTKITMEAPKLSGYTRDQRWYEMNAKSAAQDVTKPDVIELTEVRAKIETADKSTILSVGDRTACTTARPASSSSTATSCSSRRAGFEMHLDEAVVDTGSGEVVSNKPVEVFTQDATLNADRLEVEKSGEIVRFIGGVVMNLNPPRQAQTAGGGIDEREARSGAALAAAFVAAAMPCAMAQPGATNAPNALQGFQQNRGQPVQIEAARLEVRDKDKMATFSGNVKVVQGDTTMRCKSLVVFYEQQTRTAARPPRRPCRPRRPAPAARRRSASSRPAAASPSTRRTRPPPATRGLFDMKTNTVTLIGNVVVSQGQNVMRGERLVVDLPPACRASMPASKARCAC